MVVQEATYVLFTGWQYFAYMISYFIEHQAYYVHFIILYWLDPYHFFKILFHWRALSLMILYVLYLEF